MRTSPLIAIFLAVLLTSTAAQTCTLNAAVSSFASANSSCSTSGGCVLTAGLVNLLSGLGCVLTGLTGAVNLAIEPSGSGNLNIDLGASAASLFGSNGVASITLTANAGVNLVGVINSVTSIAGDVALTGAATLSVAQGVAVNIAGAINAGANSTVNVAQAAVVNVGSGVNVAATATLVVAGNVSATGAAAISGTVRLAGSKIDTALQTAWIKASSITVSGATSLVAGNGGFDGDVSLSLNATVNAGNSPGTVYVAGNLNMDATTTLQIEVAGTLNYDRIIVRGTFNRNGILYVNFIDNYLPSSDTTYNFGAHANANGDFNIVHGNYFDRTATRVSAQYSATSTNALYNSASSASASLAALLIPVVALLFASM